ncbi:uncharacterized protein LOC129233999 [Uloborus diversus]|uniref:uncharacterized protein LOC129228001 n=1 Tax=Uloborus diversus TaxID=327109 RepID=UPI00240A135A|nr:uncharacterized protein LOC129228001 [Uloborus diversus]XP_054723882.1 uncharacterized protein LOC129233999 [Uloborus diversus]
MKGFDGHFILSWLLEQGTAPNVIPNGSKLMAITHPNLNIRIIDSFNFLPMALAKLPECFGLEELKKGYFPHTFNTRENQSYVNKYCQYPIGHPDIITEGFGDIEQYFGIVKCRVVAPRELYLPVLPFRTQGKLMFPLCKTCAETLQQSPCTHTEDERALVGTWVTEEVKLAVRKGYRVTHIYEVYDFKKKSDSLFRSYIDLFLKIKQESSGWPAECVTDADKENYISQYRQREGISLDAASIEKNPGRRQVAKLALNSFWGR